ncbi:hypothetical protein NARC_110018 [Candidatus Nitrosocosmicus arcticus]|uniref:Uncharacterized protein n=1 Tax=Candidatus Nitrosocosmicus arcticus TaxID=2035267 RepID=A0A557ST75_9ARCH|nr:hypothetical protein NARC_110018 [Candidatus Nitrosocosmicus arcticus]
MKRAPPPPPLTPLTAGMKRAPPPPPLTPLTAGMKKALPLMSLLRHPNLLIQLAQIRRKLTTWRKKIRAISINKLVDNAFFANTGIFGTKNNSKMPRPTNIKVNS